MGTSKTSQTEPREISGSLTRHISHLEQFPFLTQELAAPELCVVVLECWDDDTVTGDDFLGTVAVPLAEVTAGKQLDLPLLAATLAPWPRKHGAPSLQVTFDLVYADNVRSA